MIDMDSKDKRLIGNLYWGQQATARIDNSISSFFPIKRGVRQGCILSLKLFNLYTEKIFRESNEIIGYVIGGHTVNNLRYADVLTSKSVSLDTKKRLVRCYILSTFLYTSESWTLNKAGGQD